MAYFNGTYTISTPAPPGQPSPDYQSPGPSTRYPEYHRSFKAIKHHVQNDDLFWKSRNFRIFGANKFNISAIKNKSYTYQRQPEHNNTGKNFTRSYKGNKTNQGKRIYTWINPNYNPPPRSRLTHPRNQNNPSLKCINFGLLNVNKIHSNQRQCKLFNIIHAFQIDIMCITETRIEDAQAPLTNSIPPTHTFVYSKRNRSLITRDGGGLAIIYHKKFKSIKPITLGADLNFQPKTFEFLCIEISLTVHSPGTIVLLIYRPPQTNQNLFIEEFMTVMENLLPLSKQNKVLILGDFNIAVNKTQSPFTQKFNEILNILSLQNNVHVPTYKHSSNNTLDLVIDTYTSPIVENLRVDTEASFSDHHLVLFTTKIVSFQTPNICKEFPYRNLQNDAHKELFYKQIMASSADFIQLNTSLELDNSFNNILSTAYNTFFPEFYRKPKFRKINRWFNRECQSAKSAFRKCHSKHKSNRNKHTLAAKLRALKHYHRVIFKSKQLYYRNAFKQCKKTPKKLTHSSMSSSVKMYPTPYLILH